jgi:DNA gyrase subunit B
MGKIYIAESPLFEINSGGKQHFAFTETEKTDILSAIKGKYTIQRSKGLGENEPEMMWLTTMDPKTRRLIKIMSGDPEQEELIFDLLLGDNLQGRKQHIEDNGHKYLEQIDVS